MKTTLLTLVSMILMSAAISQNAGSWTFNSTLSGTAASNLTVSNMTVGSSIPLLTTNNTIEYYGEGGWPAGGLDNNAYLQWTLTANSGYYLSFTSVRLSIRRSNTGTPTGSGPNSWSIRSSLDNYATDLYTSNNLDYNLASYVVNLPTAYQSIPSQVTFRLYGYNMTTSSGGTSRFVWDNIVVLGSAKSGVLATVGIDLRAKLSGPGDVSLSWTPEGFAAGTAYGLERSVNGVDFTEVYRTEAAGLTQYADRPAASGRVYYRVKAGNPDGSEYVSPVVSLSLSGTAGMKIRGITAQGGTVKALLHVVDGNSYQLGIWSQDGKAVLRQALNGVSGDAVADLYVGGVPHGVYVLTLMSEGQRVSRQFVL